MFTGITWNLNKAVNTDSMNNNVNESWFGMNKQFLRNKQMEIDQLPIKMDRYVNTIRPLIYWGCESYLYEIKQNQFNNDSSYLL
jgi:hypothetical protein